MTKFHRQTVTPREFFSKFLGFDFREYINGDHNLLSFPNAYQKQMFAASPPQKAPTSS